jgi:hypothetical protein
VSRKPPAKWKFVEVFWVDSSNSNDWAELSDIPDVVEMVTRGWLIRESERAITLAATYYSIGEVHKFGEYITIPRVALLSPIKTVRA